MAFSDSEEQIFNKILETVEGEMDVEQIGNLTQDVLTFSGLEIHVREQEVYHNNTFVQLSHYEFSTLLYLAKHPNWVFSKEQIYEAVWGEQGNGGAVVPNVICQLSHKIGAGYIETVINGGYKFVGQRVRRLCGCRISYTGTERDTESSQKKLALTLDKC